MTPNEISKARSRRLRTMEEIIDRAIRDARVDYNNRIGEDGVRKIAEEVLFALDGGKIERIGAPSAVPAPAPVSPAQVSAVSGSAAE